MRVDQNDAAGFINDDHRIGRRFQQTTQARVGVFEFRDFYVQRVSATSPAVGAGLG